jgi:hypothetical protein
MHPSNAECQNTWNKDKYITNILDFNADDPSWVRRMHWNFIWNWIHYKLSVIISIIVLTVAMVLNTEVAHRSDSHSRDEVIPFPRSTSSVNAGFPRPPRSANSVVKMSWQLRSRICVFHLLFQTIWKPKLSYRASKSAMFQRAEVCQRRQNCRLMVFKMACAFSPMAVVHRHHSLHWS